MERATKLDGLGQPGTIWHELRNLGAPETFAVPLRDRIRVDYDQATRPPGPEGPQYDPKGAVNIVERGTRPLALECAKPVDGGPDSRTRVPNGRERVP